MTRTPDVFGKTVDEHTRCVHYATELDIIAIRFACCDRYFPCHLCHSETADHPAMQWPTDKFDQPAILRELLERTDDRGLQSSRQLPRMPRTLQPPLRRSLGLLLRFLISHRSPLRSATEI